MLRLIADRYRVSFVSRRLTVSCWYRGAWLPPRTCRNHWGWRAVFGPFEVYRVNPS